MMHHPGNIAHQLVGIFEDIGIDPLENIGIFLVISAENNLVGVIDVTASVGFHRTALFCDFVVAEN